MQHLALRVIGVHSNVEALTNSVGVTQSDYDDICESYQVRDVEIAGQTYPFVSGAQAPRTIALTQEHREALNASVGDIVTVYFDVSELRVTHD